MPDSDEWMQLLRRRKEEKEKELKAEEEEDEDPTGWTLAYDNYGRQYFWHRRTRRTVWEIPESAILRMKGMRKRKKKKKLSCGSSFSRSSRVRIRRCGLGRALVLRGFLMCSLPYCCCGRARRRFRQWHKLEWLAGCFSRVATFFRTCWRTRAVLCHLLLVMMHLVLCFLRLSMSVAIPQVQFLDKVVQISCRGAEADSHGLLFRRT